MIDLHIHTRASDGTWTPDQAVREAKKIGLTAMAITDHDSLASVDAGMAAARTSGLRFLTAVEVSAGSSTDEIRHILGYGVDPGHPGLRLALAVNQAAWDENEAQSLVNLARLGINISGERYDYWTEHREAGGWPTYNCLVELGLVRDYQEYFERYFGPGRPAQVVTVFLSPAEAIADIKAAGGVPALAHPGAQDPMGRTILDREGYLDALVGQGIEGFEVFANENSPAVTEYLLGYCQRRSLLVTGGSDCHGEFAGRTLGQPSLPSEYLSPLLDRLTPGTYL